MQGEEKARRPEGRRACKLLRGDLLAARLDAPVFLLGGPEGAHPDGVPIRVVFRPQVIYDMSALDDVDAVVAGVHLAVGGVGADAEGRGAPEEVSHDLAYPRLAVVVLARRTVALELAVLEKRLYGVTSSVPMQVEPDLALGRGDDRAVSHDWPPGVRGAPFLRVRLPGERRPPEDACGGKGGSENRRPELSVTFVGNQRKVFRGPCRRVRPRAAWLPGRGVRRRSERNDRAAPLCNLSTRCEEEGVSDTAFEMRDESVESV